MSPDAYKVAKVRYFVGVDLGYARDHTAISVVERAVIQHVYGSTVETLHRLRYCRRVPLLTPYPDVVPEVADLVSQHPLEGRCVVVMDATGVGAPVVELMRRNGVGAPVIAVSITGGDTESSDGTVHHVPKRDLVVGLQVALQRRWLQIVDGPGVKELCTELLEMRWRDRGQRRAALEGVRKDDMVMATALAWWWVRHSWSDGVEKGRVV